MKGQGLFDGACCKQTSLGPRVLFVLLAWVFVVSQLLVSYNVTTTLTSWSTALYHDTPEEEEQQAFESFWTEEHQVLLKELKEDVLSAPVLVRPNFGRRFYVKTDWAKFAMAAVLLQANPDNECAAELEHIKAAGGPCFFKLTKSGI